MPKQVYDWKRFWCPWTGSIDLADGGYLPNPDEKWFKEYNPDLVTLEEIFDVPCLVLLGEPGVGKSQELSNLKDLTAEKIPDTNRLLALNLRSCSRLRDDLFKDEIFLEWLESNYHLYLFLDSLDEGLLSVPTLSTGLIDELQKKKYREHLYRLHIRIACRTFIFPGFLEEELKKLWQETNVRIYELVPLRRVDVASAAKAEGFSPERFLEEIAQKAAVPLAIKPITLGFLLNTYRKQNGQFSSDQKLHDLYLEGCKLLCEEVSLGRRASNRVGNLDGDQRLMVVARIAAVTIFANRFAIWTEVDQGDIPVGDVPFQVLWFGYEEINGKKFEISRIVIEEVLDTGLFSSRGLNRMGWAHQTYTEFLAAWYLTQNEVPLEQIKRLICSSEDSGCRLVPQLYETAAWLASMRHDVLQTIMETDPDILLKSDLLGIDEKAKASLVDSLLELYDSGKLAYQYDGSRQFQHLTHPGILEKLIPYISDSTKKIQARYVAIDIAESCNLKDASPILVKVALAPEQPYLIRSRAARFLVDIGRESDKARLRDLYVFSQDDPEDELKGYGLSATYPKHITTEEILSRLTQPQANYVGGRYQRFVARDLGEHLPESDLEVALEWLKRQPVRRELHYPFSELSDSIMLRAWDYLDNPVILSSFAEIVVSRQSQYDQVIDKYGNASFKKMLQEDDVKRRALLEKCVSIIQNSHEDPYWLSGNSHYSSLTPLKQDFVWLIEKIKTSTSKKIQKVYAKLIYREFDWESAEQISLIITASQTSSALREEFASVLEFIPLNSQRVGELKSQYLERQQYLTQIEQQKLDPPPKTRVLQCLDEFFEAGQVDAWWKLCQEMTLLPTSTHYNQTWEVDITTLPGWQEADETVRQRIIEAAKQYIYKGHSNTESWLGRNSFPQYVSSGYKALRLVSAKEPEFISTLPVEIWQKWTAIILNYPNAKEDESTIREDLIRRAYHNAPNELFRVLGILIDQENSQDGCVYIHREVECCWDKTLENFLLAKLQDEAMAAEGLRNFLETLLAHHVSEAISFAESLIVFPLPEIDEERAKVAVAVQILILHAASTEWPIIWKIVQECPEFGKEVFEKVSFDLKYNWKLEQQLQEKDIADLYIFLVKHYPDLDTEGQIGSETEELTGLQARNIGPEDSIRQWRDSIPHRLQELGKPEALRRIINELPALKDNLQWRLPQAEALARRENWQPPKPEELLQLVIGQEPSNSDLSNQIDIIEWRTEKMEKEPKIDKSIRIKNSNIPGVVNTGDGRIENGSAPLHAGRKLDWKFWLSTSLALLIGLGSVFASGVFNDEIRNFLFRENIPSPVEDNSNSD